MMRKIFGRTYVRIIILIILGSVASFFVVQKAEELIGYDLFVPENKYIYVDQNSLNQRENGSFYYPCKTVGSALNIAKENPGLDTIFINSGNYRESIELMDGISLIGVGEDVYITNPERVNGRTLQIAGMNHMISKINVVGGRYGIYLDKNSTADIVSCSVKNAGWYGIYNEAKDDVGSNFDIRVVRSAVSNNKLQGLYLQKANILFSNSNSNDNGEEGIDLHVDIRAVIRNNEISNNGEGGIESEIGGNYYEIFGNTIVKNASSGINMQSSGENSQIIIRNNIVKDNVNFGLRCALHEGLYRGYFTKYLNFSEGNDFDGNGKEGIDPNCKEW